MVRFTMNKDVIFHFVYVCAMRDAVLQGAYEGKRKWLSTNETVDTENRVKMYIDHILEIGFATQDEHDEEFMKVAFDICNIINQKIPTDEKSHFSFGNAQKLINMCSKYFYLICYKAECLRENFKFCHCPMDSVLLEHVWKEIKKQSKMKACEFKKSWGKEDWKSSEGSNLQLPDRYNLFQENIRYLAAKKSVLPIEYDYLAWEDK